MSIYRVTKNDVETLTVLTNPTRTYRSSSQGVTGSVFVFPRHSDIEKEVAPLSTFIESKKNDADLGSMLKSVQAYGRMTRFTNASPVTNQFNQKLTSYLDKVNIQSSSTRKRKQLDVIRFTPTFNYTSNTARKLVVKDLLNPYYRVSYPTAHWAYTNYHSLNFYTSSLVPSSSALLYPNVSRQSTDVNFVSGTYNVSGPFSFDFYINPRYTTDKNDGVFNAGTLFHLSSSYALSLVSGSAKDQNGRPIGFRLKLQLSHSADIAPSRALQGNYPNDLVFLSDDNSLMFNRWHHVVVRWGTNTINNGTGSFNIDMVDKGTFVVPSSSVNPRATPQPPATLVVGNYYDGFDDMSQFFAVDPALRDGLNQMNSTTGVEEPILYRFSHHLNAEVHDLAIKRTYMSDDDIAVSSSKGLTSIDTDKVAFYLPPFFVPESPFRQFVGDHGGIMQTPFFEVDGTTDDPFNVAMSFGVGGHYVNIENFLRDFSSNVFPRVHLMTGTVNPYTTQLRSANEFLYDDPNVRRRNTLIMPCDDGLFVPSYELLASESQSNKRKFVDALGVEELSFISLDNLIMTHSLLFGTTFGSDDKTDDEANSLVNELIGFTPETPGNRPGTAFTNYVDIINAAVLSGTFDAGLQTFAPLTVYQRTLDPSSNQVTIFDISNLFLW